MGQLRVEKIQEFIKQEASKLILQDIKDPRIGFVTVTRVEVTSDLSSAKLYISSMGSAEQKKATWEGLNRALGFLRTEIGKRLKIRHSPQLSLHVDETLDYSNNIEKLLREIKQNEG